MLWNAVAARRDYDVIRLGQVREDAKVNALITAAEVNPWVETREETYFIPVNWKSGEEWLQAQETHARKQTGMTFAIWQRRGSNTTSGTRQTLTGVLSKLSSRRRVAGWLTKAWDRC